MWLDKLRAMKERSGLTVREIAQRSQLPEATLEKLFAGATKDPRLGTVSRLVHFFGCTLDELDDFSDGGAAFPEEAAQLARAWSGLTDHGKGAVRAILDYECQSAVQEPAQRATLLPRARRGSGGLTEIRVYDQPAAAGLGNYLDEPAYHLEQYPREVIPSKTDFGVIISGDSMEPRIHDGGTVFVQAQPNIEPGQLGIFLYNGQAYCKKLVVDHSRRQVRLSSLNPRYEDIVIAPGDGFQTMGRVLGQWTPGQKQDPFGW